MSLSGPSVDLGTEVRWRFDHCQRVFPLVPVFPSKPGGAARTRGALAPIQPPISGRKSPKMHHSHVPAVVFAQVNLSAPVIRQRTVQRRSPAGEARLPRGAGSTAVTVMLFNTGIPLASSGIKALSSQPELFAWEGVASGRGPRKKKRGWRQMTGRWPGTFGNRKDQGGQE